MSHDVTELLAPRLGGPTAMVPAKVAQPEAAR